MVLTVRLGWNPARTHGDSGAALEPQNLHLLTPTTAGGQGGAAQEAKTNSDPDGRAASTRAHGRSGNTPSDYVPGAGPEARG